MKKLSKCIIGYFVLCMMVGTSCTERYYPELADFENNLVVDGQITNEAGPYTIRLSFSSNLDLIEYQAVEGATVIIVEEYGTSEILSEVRPGQYQTSPTGIQGKIGSSYKLQIENPEGEFYESDYQKLKAPTTITDVYAEIETKFFTEYNADRDGLQFYVDAGESPNDSDYFLWITEATFKYETKNLIKRIYEGFSRVFPTPKAFKTCWQKDTINKVATYNTALSANTSVKKIPLHFVPSTSIVLSIRYSPLVKQYTISEEAFEYWQAIEAQLDTDAPLYSSQPYQTRGNMKNINDAEETVLGFFLVAGVDEKRVFVDAPRTLDLYQPDCYYDYEGHQYLYLVHSSRYPIYIAEGPDGLALMPAGCLDCRDRGGDIIRPAYWID